MKTINLIPRTYAEKHRISNIGWLRAAVLGANDGIVSTASLVLGVASSHAPHSTVLMTGIAGLVAGSMSMATGEYVSVSSQLDTEKNALQEEEAEIKEDFGKELSELAAIYVSRGLDLPLATEVAEKLMKYDANGAHARDELGISELTSARPLQAAIASAGSFAVGSILPIVIVMLVPEQQVTSMVAGTVLLSLAFLGGLAAKAGGAKILPGIIRVTFWSALAMGVTSAVGALFGAK